MSACFIYEQPSPPINNPCVIQLQRVGFHTLSCETQVQQGFCECNYVVTK